MYSFDVFDTLITRKTALPEGIYAVMQYNLSIDNDMRSINKMICENFYDMRIGAEKLARYHYHERKEDVTWDEIYEVFSLHFGLEKDITQKLKELEWETEYEYSLPIWGNIERIKKLIRDGEEVVLLSDMYMDQQSIRNLLLKHDSIFRDLPLYVSCECKAQKSTGTLYRHVQRERNVNLTEWIHVGNDSYSDGTCAKNQGIEAVLLEMEPLLPFEKRILSAYSKDPQVQKLIGLSRYARWGKKAKMPYKIGTSLGGGILFPYIWWVLRECNEQGIRRLYFLARDGWLLQKIADIIIKKERYDIQTKYLYASRKAWRLSSLTEAFSVEEFLFYQNYVTTWQELGEIFQMPPEEIKSFLPENEETKKWMEYEQFTREDVLEFARELEQQKDFKELILSKNQKDKVLLKRYIMQEVDYRDEYFAFVELDGSGYTMKLFADFFAEFSNRKTHTFYMLLDWFHQNKAFIPQVYCPTYELNAWMVELLSRAFHGQTIGYQERGEKIEPVLEETRVDLLEESGYSDYIAGVMTYSELLASEHENENLCRLFIEYLQTLLKHSDPEIFDFLGEIPFSGSQSDGSRKLAPKLTQEEIRNIYLLQSEQPKELFYKGLNYELSFKRLSNREKEKIEDYKFGHKLEPFKNKKLILYGAGKRGEEVYKRLSVYHDIQIVAWVDRNYKGYQEEGKKVQSPQFLYEMDFDIILVVVATEKLAKEIMGELVEQHISRDKIIWIPKL
jgi:predicted HAD superfamily hydrolase